MSRGLPNGTRSCEDVTPQQRQRYLEKSFGGHVGVRHLAVGGDDNDRERQCIEHRIGGRNRHERFGGIHAACLNAPLLPPSASNASTSRRCTDRGIRGGEHVMTVCLEQGFVRTGGRRGGIERPAQMLPRMTQPDSGAVMDKHFVV